MVEATKTCSISLRLRRVTYEDAYVSVLITDALLQLGDNGKFGIDPEAFINEAVRLGEDPRVEWKIESSQIEPHPAQGPKPEGRIYFDSSYTERKQNKLLEKELFP